jgi:hypothetical protein
LERHIPPPIPRTDKPLVYMRFRPAWTYIDGIREFGGFFCESTFADARVAERSTMVLQEMLENAVKYSTRAADTELELELSLSEVAGGLEISITSRPDPGHLDLLRRELALLYARPPEEAYLAAFERAAGDNASGSRLGLARIRYEGKSEISIVDHHDGKITMTARGQL